MLMTGTMSQVLNKDYVFLLLHYFGCCMYIMWDHHPSTVHLCSYLLILEKAMKGTFMGRQFLKFNLQVAALHVHQVSNF